MSRNTESDDVLAEALDNVDQGIVVYDSKLIVRTFNRQVLEMLQMPADRFHSGGSFEDWIRNNANQGGYGGAGSVEERVAKRLAVVRSFEPYCTDHTLIDGRTVEIRGKPLPSGGYVTTYTDVSARVDAERALLESQRQLEDHVLSLRDSEERMEEQAARLVDVADELAVAEDKMKFLANHDPLTELPSMRLCRDRIEMAMADAWRNDGRFALMFVDLDGFKSVNDEHGHEAGDTVLKEVALRMSNAVRKTDTVARIGGDEFIVLLTGVKDGSGTAGVAQKLIDRVSQPISVDDDMVIVGASIGIALFPGDGDSVDSLLQRADELMYEVKRAGKNNFGFADQGSAVA